MRDVSSFLIENTIDLKPLMSNIPVPIIKNWVVEYKKEKTKESFEDWVERRAWMLVDSSYSKVKNYTIFLLNTSDKLSIFSTLEKLGQEVNSEFVLNYFKPLFESIFLDGKGNYNEKNLKDWAKSYNSLGRREFYINLVEKRDSFEEPEFSQILLGLFIQSLGVTIENYFDLVNATPPSLEDAEYLILGFLDCSDPKLSIQEKWRYMEKNGRFLNSDVFKRALYQMLKDKNLIDQRRIVQQLTGMKNKKLRLNVIQDKLSIPNQHLFCSAWQKIAGV